MQCLETRQARWVYFSRLNYTAVCLCHASSVSTLEAFLGGSVMATEPSIGLLAEPIEEEALSSSLSLL